MDGKGCRGWRGGWWIVATLLGACGGDDRASNVAAPGQAESLKTRMLESGAALLQDKPPIEALNAYLDGFHFYNGRADQQMEAHHYCSQVNDEVRQCVIFDGNGGDAKLMGVEYILSARLFQSLPAEEKTFWHSHVHEVKSGQLLAPGIPAVAEHALMAQLVGTYGKTWHTWHTDQQLALPQGIPQLMMGFTADGQLHPRMLAGRDRRLGIDSREKAGQRADIVAPAIDPQADAWQRESALQLQDPRGAEAPAH
ncbi:MAG: OBAP family protein [Pseudomonas sp.]|uniref:OBAP family protein n=1 Tax=Pseudomonas sp. TaxID=306 RepID=UPI00339245D3